MARDRKDGEFCDLEIVCGGTRFRAHRIVVFSRSAVIRAACLGPWKEGACGVFEIKESSDALVQRLLDYIYTGKYDDFPSKIAVEQDQESSSDSSELSHLSDASDASDASDSDDSSESSESSDSSQKVVDCPVMGHAKMMELGDMYLVDGLSLLASERFAKVLTSETTENILDNIIPEVYALNFNSSKVIRKTVIDYMRKRLAREPLAADVKKSLEQAMTDVPVFIHQLLESFIDSPVLGHCRTCGVEKTVPIKPLQRKCLLCNRGGALELSTCD
ncbi:hypothetical protein E4U32_002925 [Claviceps aff. humidiphila group G2b]|nr:hypothetical protein E4U32_002925 [Claviceps aff. humidiphila group G2b]